MALPTPDNLKTMDYAHQGQPFVDVPSKDSVDIKTMDWAYQAQPFVRNLAPPPAVGRSFGYIFGSLIFVVSHFLSLFARFFLR